MGRHADRIKEALRRDGASALTASWRRCLDVYGLDPEAVETPPRDLAVLAQSRALNADMMAVGQPCLDQLFALLSHVDCAFMLADRNGLLIDVRTNRERDPWGRSPDIWCGMSFAEPKLGTNGIGTCLAEQRAVTIRGQQHFLECLSQRVGISSPLFGPSGDLIGCLHLNQCTEAHDARLDNFLSTSISNFARRIETELFARAHPASRLVLASPGGRLDALLAVDPDDRVIGATRGARRLLELGDRAIARAPNMNDIFNDASGADGHDLADVERRTIVRALARCGGNHSAAAKAIGISRSTLYRKLRSYKAPVPTTVEPSALKPPSSA